MLSKKCSHIKLKDQTGEEIFSFKTELNFTSVQESFTNYLGAYTLVYYSTCPLSFVMESSIGLETQRKFLI